MALLIHSRGIWYLVHYLSMPLVNAMPSEENLRRVFSKKGGFLRRNDVDTRDKVLVALFTFTALNCLDNVNGHYYYYFIIIIIILLIVIIVSVVVIAIIATNQTPTLPQKQLLLFFLELAELIRAIEDIHGAL